MTDKELYKLIQNTKYIKTTMDVDYQIIHKDGCCYLLFQDSRDKQDWKVNFNFPRKLYRGCRMMVHRGYGKAYKAVREEIIPKYILEVWPSEEMVIAGWSYGASMAILAAEDLYYLYEQKVKVITYGGAKIAYGLFTRNYLKRCMHLTEYVQQNDLVTWMVPWGWRISKKVVGDNFSFKRLKNSGYYHTHYSEFID